jgi:hypothetical protein
MGKVRVNDLIFENFTLYIHFNDWTSINSLSHLRISHVPVFLGQSWILKSHSKSRQTQQLFNTMLIQHVSAW